MFVFVVIGQSPARRFTRISHLEGSAGPPNVGAVRATCFSPLFRQVSGEFAGRNIDFCVCVKMKVLAVLRVRMVGEPAGGSLWVRGGHTRARGSHMGARD